MTYQHNSRITEKSEAARAFFAGKTPSILPIEFETIEYNEDHMAPGGLPSLQWRIPLMKRMKNLQPEQVIAHDFSSGEATKEAVRRKIGTFRMFYLLRFGVKLSIRRRNDELYNISILSQPKG